MNNFMRSAFLVCTLVVFCGCGGGKFSTWGHFHGDLSNQGFQAIDSGYALSSSWISNSYKITSASPVIGKDLQDKEVVYIGTSDGMLVAVRAEDGSEKWRRSFGPVGSETRIVSSASVSDQGNIFVITSRKVGEGRASSTLHNSAIRNGPTHFRTMGLPPDHPRLPLCETIRLFLCTCRWP
jgi:hypothetical protein